MTVKEAIEELKKCPPDFQVYYPNYDEMENREITSVEMTSFAFLSTGAEEIILLSDR